MRVLVLANKPPYPPNDGGAFATLNMALGLAESGFEVTLLAMSTPKHPTEAKDFPQLIRDQMQVYTVFVNTKLSPFKALCNLLFSKHAYNAQRFISKRYVAALKDLLSKNSYDIVQLEGLYLYPYMELIRSLHQGKISLRAHNVEHEIWERNAAVQRNGFKRFYFNHLAQRVKRAELNVLNQIDWLIPISERDEAKLKELGFKGLSFTSPTGYRISQPLPLVENFEFPSIFHLGSLDWIPNREGIFWFLESCWPHVLTSVPEAKFYVAGRNATPELIVRLKTYANTIFVGEVDDAAAFMNSKAIMVVPLLSGSGMRIKIVEGMALGKAIVSTSIGAEGIAVTSEEHLVIADTPYAMAKSIVELCLAKEQVIKLGHNAQQFVKHNLDNAVLTGKLAHFYRLAHNA